MVTSLGKKSKFKSCHALSRTLADPHAMDLALSFPLNGLPSAKSLPPTTRRRRCQMGSHFAVFAEYDRGWESVPNGFTINTW